MVVLVCVCVCVCVCVLCVCVCVCVFVCILHNNRPRLTFGRCQLRGTVVAKSMT